MKKLIFLTICLIALGWLYYSGKLNQYLPNDYKLAEETKSLIDDTVKPVTKEVVQVLKEMKVTKENLFDIKEQVGFETLLKSLIDKENYTMAGGLIYWESQEFIKGIEVTTEDFTKQYQFIQDNLQEHKDQILKESYELALEVFKIELKNDIDLAKGSLMAIKVNFPNEILDDENCYELQLAVLQNKEFKVIKDIHTLCLENGKHVSATFEVVEYMKKNGLENDIKLFYIPIQRKFNGLPSFEELQNMFQLNQEKQDQSE